MKTPLHPPPLFAPDAGLAPDVASLVAAARRRGIPCIRHPGGAGLVQLGWGRRARRIQGAVTGNTSHIAVQIARDPSLSKSLLRDAGVPVPAGVEAHSAREAVEIFRCMGAPVVVRSLETADAEETATGLASDDAVRAAYERARRSGAGVVVERELAGAEHRALVVDGRLVAVARLSPPAVTGDGFHTVMDLLDAANRARPRAGAARIPADEAAQGMLARQGLALESIPPAGMRVKLRGADLAGGATAEDVTAAVHPGVADACERAARAIGLDVAGVAFACADASVALEAQGGGVLCVTAAPDICMHERAGSAGVADAVLRTLFPEGGDGRIPLFAVAGGGEAVPRVMAHALQAAGLRAGTATGDGIRIGRALLRSGDWTLPESALAVLGSPEVEAAILTVSGGPLAFDRCDVAVLVDPSIAAMRWALGLAASARSLVLDAEDPRSAALARTRSPGASIVYVRTGEAAGPAGRDIEAGAPCVYLGRDALMLASADRRVSLIERLRMSPALRIEEALAAAAALWAYGLEEGAIAAALAPLSGTRSQPPARAFDGARSEPSPSHAHR